MTQQIPPVPSPEKSYIEKYKKPILISVAIVIVFIVLIVLVSPIIAVPYTVTQTRTRDFQYSSGVYGYLSNFPQIVNVTNEESIGGDFSITMNWWYNNPLGPAQLKDTSTQSAFISGETTHTFSLPSSWAVVEPIWFLTYSISAPTVQEAYNVTQTKYTSILDLIWGS